MPRPPRRVAEGVPYHVVQRGNNRRRIFFQTHDYRHYIELLKRYTSRHELQILGYCLMPNHVHLVAIPQEPESLPLAIGQAHNVYSRWLNHRLGRIGHLWVRRYYAAPMDRDHFLTALRYVDRNPVRAQMTADATGYRWSSAAAHVTGLDSSGVLDMPSWREHVHAHTYWSEILASTRSEAAQIDAIRAGTEAGRAIGPEPFQRDIALRLGLPWPPKKRGRPSKQTEAVRKAARA